MRDADGQIQKIMNDFERESSTMDMKEEMMSDAVDDAMEGEDEGEGEEVEGDKILKEVFDEIGMSMNDAVCVISPPFFPPDRYARLGPSNSCFRIWL